MKYAPWAALVLLIVSICSTMWIVMSVATNMLMPSEIPRPLDASKELSIISGMICMIVPLTAAMFSFVLWRVSRRQQLAPVVAAPTPAWTGSFQPAPVPTSAPMPTTVPAPQASVQLSAAAPAPVHRLPQIRQAPSQMMMLEAYMAEITELLVAPDEDEQPMARLAMVQARTRQVLHELDTTYRARVLQVLHSRGWLSGSQQVHLHDINLSGIDLRFMDLRQARLVSVNLSGANLVGAQLSGANLSGANLDGADLRMADLDQALFYQTSLRRARLHRSNLRGAVLHGAQLHQANLWRADLTQAQVTDEQLNKAISLSGAVMPDGTKHR